MAVTDLFIEGTVLAGNSVTLQPAAGVCWSFKRGVLGTTGGEHVRITSGGRDFLMQFYTTTTAASFSNLITHLSFSEAGCTAHQGSPQGYATASGHPFGAMTNTRTVQLSGGSFTSAFYAMVGVALS